MLTMAAGVSGRRMNLQSGHLTNSWEANNGNGPSELRLVIAIDFGTFASGYALQWRSDFNENRLKINFNKKWGERTHLCTYKTPTSLLLKPDRSICEFGYKAETIYNQLGSPDGQYRNERPNDWYLFRQFKMQLHNRENLTDDTPIEGENGNNLSAIEVFSKSIEYMKNHVIAHVTMGGVPYPEKDTKWVITVPAIWDETAKLLMQRAAIKAGICERNLTIALEPECAAIYCSQVSVDQMTISGDKGRLRYVAAPGSTIMVVDIGVKDQNCRYEGPVFMVHGISNGTRVSYAIDNISASEDLTELENYDFHFKGGTVDVTTVKINTDGTMKQVYLSEGGPWGGKRVDDKFYVMLRKMVTEDVLLDFIREYPEEYYDFRMAFESEKRQVSRKDADSSQQRFRICLPNGLKTLWEGKVGKGILDIIKDLNGADKDVMFNRGRISFSMDVIRGFFQETISEIKENVQRVLGTREHSGITLDSLVLVGGFAESDFVVQSLREDLKTIGIPVVRPESTELAVLNGAVLFGQNEAIITSRILSYTYGVGMIMEFDPKIHRQDTKFEEDGKQWANDVFRKHVVKGQEVKFGEWISGKVYFPVDESQTSATVYVYSSDKKDPVHTSDAGCKYIGHREIKFANTMGQGGHVSKSVVTIEFLFGGTLIKLKITDKASDKTFYATLNMQ